MPIYPSITSEELRNKFIRILETVDSRYFQDTIEKIKKFQVSAKTDEFVSQLKLIAFAAGQIRGKIESVEPKQFNRRQWLMLQLLCDPVFERELINKTPNDPEITFENVIKFLQEKSVKLILEIGSMIDRDEQSDDEEDHIIIQCHDFIESALSELTCTIERFLNHCQQRTQTSFVIREAKAEGEIPPDILTVDQEDSVEVDLDEVSACKTTVIVGTENLNCCIALYCHGQARGANKHIAVLAHIQPLEFESHYDNVMKLFEDPSSVKVCIIGGNVYSLPELLDFLQNHPTVNDFRINLSDGFRSSAVFVDLHKIHEISYVVYYGDIFNISNQDDKTETPTSCLPITQQTYFFPPQPKKQKRDDSTSAPTADYTETAFQPTNP